MKIKKLEWNGTSASIYDFGIFDILIQINKNNFGYDAQLIVTDDDDNYIVKDIWFDDLDNYGFAKTLEEAKEYCQKYFENWLTEFLLA